MSDKRIPEINNEPLSNDTYNAVSSKHNKRDFKMKGKSKYKYTQALLVYIYSRS